LLKRADTRGSADIYCMWPMSLLRRSGHTPGSGIVNDATKYRSRTEYLMPTDNVIVEEILSHWLALIHFNMTFLIIL